MRVFKKSTGKSKEPNQAEVSKYKDFGSVITNYESTLKRLHKKPLYKDPKAFLFLVLILLITYLMIKDQQGQKDSVNDTIDVELNDSSE